VLSPDHRIIFLSKPEHFHGLFVFVSALHSWVFSGTTILWLELSKADALILTHQNTEEETLVSLSKVTYSFVSWSVLQSFGL
jgi:hypothetical protein